MDPLFQLFNDLGSLPDPLTDYIQSCLKTSEVDADHYFVKEGSIARNISFIDKGIIRSFKLRDNIDMTSYFMMKGDIFCSVRSFFKQVAARESIITVEPCIIRSITFQQYERILKEWPCFNLHRAEILLKYYLEADDREDMRQWHAYEKFTYLMKNSSELVGRVPDHLLASYLTMHKDTFSNMKSQYSGKNNKE